MGRFGRSLSLTLLVAATAAAQAGSSHTAASSAPSGRIAYAPRVFPKDQRIVDNWEIYAVSPAGGRSVNLTRSGYHDVAPAWSHDGQWIAFVREQVGTGRFIMVMSRDRRSLRTVLELRSGNVSELAWSPDDRRLAFAGGGIKVINADGTGLRRLTRGPDGSPSWSPDGQTIVFGRRAQVFRVGADGKALSHIARGAGPALSPDARTIASLGSGGGIWLMDANGSRRRKLRRAGDGNWDLAWSPDGRYLAYQYQHSEIAVIAADGTSRRLLPTQGSDFGGMDWGPDLAR